MNTNTIQSEKPSIPRVGMWASVRKRRGIITEVRENGRYHLVRVEYKDDLNPGKEELVWELEVFKELLEPNQLPQAKDRPMNHGDFQALIRSCRWNAIQPFINPEQKGSVERLPFSSPFYGAIDVDDYQLIPLLKALRMPRVNLFIADDVGLGKTIEAGLILSELLIRRRVNRILILTPASLRIQWRDEMWSKFSLQFDIIDRDSTFQMRKSMGIDLNPWRSFSRIITSYHYLRQPDVLEQFLSASRYVEGSPQLPWDLIIVDEVHNLMPAPFGDDSQLCQMLRTISPMFEHRIFLTATPHNGHTRSFTGLLELLDPVRFSRTDELKPAERERVKQVVIRRLKREINQRTNPPKFCTRKPPHAVMVEFSDKEHTLIQAFEKFRKKIRQSIGTTSRKKAMAGNFAIEILGKRLLSGPMPFLESWSRCKLGLIEDEIAEDSEVIASAKAFQEDLSDDREHQQRESSTSMVIGSWMKAIKEDVEKEIKEIDQAAERLGIKLDSDIISQNPAEDARFHVFCKLIDKLLRHNDKWRDDERLVVFTEYKTTLDYLYRRIQEKFPHDTNRFLTLYGGMNDYERERIKTAFNDENADVRILIATDAASEGLNLQSTARYLLHYDCPWNPSRIEQRNGRLDRHGQARDVVIFHYVSEHSSDLKFMAYLIQKVDQIREDLGAVAELFDEATHRCLIEGDNPDNVQSTLDNMITQVTQSIKIDADDSSQADSHSDHYNLMQRMNALRKEIDLDIQTQWETLDTAMSVDHGRPQLSEPDEKNRFSLLNPNLMGWKDIIKDTIRLQTNSRTLGCVPYLTFSIKPFIEKYGEREVYKPRKDTLMLHQGHPLMQKAIGTLVRKRYPGAHSVSRWTVCLSDIPSEYEAVIHLHVEELGVNQLRETFHHWVSTHRIPVQQGELGEPLSHIPSSDCRFSNHTIDPAVEQKAQNLLYDLEPDLQDYVQQYRENINEKIQKQLEEDGKQAREDEQQRFQSRQGEISTLITETTIQKLEKEIADLKQKKMMAQIQTTLFEGVFNLEELERSITAREEEIERRRKHYEEVRDQLNRERERIIKLLLPKRYALQDRVQVFPLAVEVHFPRKGGNGQ